MHGKEKIKISKDEIKIINSNLPTNTIMHSGEKHLMARLADIATKNGGDILEIGFGLHLSADAVQSNPNVKSHTIIEIHPEIYKSALTWAKDKPNVNIILGDWIKILPILGGKFDGIIHDTHIDRNIPFFLDYVKNNCKKGAIVAFFEYMLFDTRFNGVRYKLNKEDYDSLPYRNNQCFFNYEYELKYTTFNGIDFYSDRKVDKLI